MVITTFPWTAVKVILVEEQIRFILACGEQKRTWRGRQRSSSVLPPVPIPASGSSKVREPLLLQLCLLGFLQAHLPPQGLYKVSYRHISSGEIHTLCYIDASSLRSYQVRVGADSINSYIILLLSRKSTHCGFPFCTSWAAMKTLGLGIPTTLSACEAYSRVANGR
jgi:hypothetical protein